MVRISSVNGRKSAKRLAAAARAKRLLNLKRKREPLISDRILKLLAAAEKCTAKAVEPIRNPDMKPRDMSGPQRLGDANNLQGPGYSNDVANDWRRGGGASGAEGKPNFDRGLRRPGKV
jgi:hypothetical protein